MDKRDEIRDRVISNIVKACPEMLNGNILKLADKILKDEDSMGVAIKADRELSEHVKQNIRGENDDYFIGFRACHDYMVKAGYVAFERLIKE